MFIHSEGASLSPRCADGQNIYTGGGMLALIGAEMTSVVHGEASKTEVQCFIRRLLKRLSIYEASSHPLLYLFTSARPEPGSSNSSSHQLSGKKKLT